MLHLIYCTLALEIHYCSVMQAKWPELKLIIKTRSDLRQVFSLSQNRNSELSFPQCSFRLSCCYKSTFCSKQSQNECIFGFDTFDWHFLLLLFVFRWCRNSYFYMDFAMWLHQSWAGSGQIQFCNQQAHGTRITQSQSIKILHHHPIREH